MKHTIELLKETIRYYKLQKDAPVFPMTDTKFNVNELLSELESELQQLERREKLDRFIQGYVCAVCCMIRLDGLVDTRTKEMYMAGVGSKTLKELQDMGVDELDLETLKTYWKDLN